MLFFEGVALYLATGFVVAIACALFGAVRLIEGAPPISAGARALLIPGIMLFWPLVIARWRKARAP